MDADADEAVTDDDPAKHRVVLIDERNEALGSTLLGVVVLLSAVPLLILSVSSNDIMLLVGTVLVPAALGLGLKCLLSGFFGYVSAAFRLRQLHTSKTGLPPARLVD